ncbi:MAG TPA: serine/threonine-protein kinase, partial [Thermoanaerobaculia bacterium]|nr:serine/threonine-protein kinase [Thermoanaerobaculia bacterium]
AANLLRSLPASVRRAELLEKAGFAPEAVRGYLAAGATEKARNLTDRAPNRDRLLAEVHLQNGQAVEAANIFARLGLPREAAEAYEAAQQWGAAAYRWEAAQEPKRAAQAYERAGQMSNAGRCYAAAGMTRLAVDAYVRDGNISAAADLHVRAGQLLDAASLYLSKQEKSRAAAILMRIQRSDASFGLGTLLLAPLLIDEGFAADALERVRSIPAVCGDTDPELLRMERSYWEGRALEALDRRSEAEDCYARVADSNPDHRDTRERLERLRPPPPPPVVTPAPVAGPPEVLEVGGRVAGRYDILEELGRGGMGKVFKAYDRELGETVALKGLVGVGDGGFGEEARLLQEIQICRRISHPNVVRVFDLGRYPHGIFLTMEYLEGRRLDELIIEEHPLPFARIRGLIAEIAAGLREAHTLGIVHRDLKPSNVMITPTRLKILDFGIAAMAGAKSRMTQAGFLIGSPMYMSPDQILGRALDGRSDLYTLGILAYCMIAGREPYDGVESRMILKKKLRDPPPDARAFRADTPKAWVALVAKLLAKKADNRYQSADELLAALDELPADEPAARPVSD